MINKTRSLITVVSVCAVLALAACSSNTGEEYAADAYNPDQVNSQQEVKQIQIVSILPAKIVLKNDGNRHATQAVGSILGAIAGGVLGRSLGSGHSDLGAAAGAIGGGTLGAVAGSTVNDKKFTEGVTITFKDPSTNKVFSSTQVGRACQFIPGNATMISSVSGETRIQANATCPAK